jgi:hypothetical protein
MKKKKSSALLTTSCEQQPHHQFISESRFSQHQLLSKTLNEQRASKATSTALHFLTISAAHSPPSRFPADKCSEFQSWAISALKNQLDFHAHTFHNHNLLKPKFQLDPGWKTDRVLA